MEDFFSKAGLDRINSIKSLNDFCYLIKENTSRDVFNLSEGLSKLSSSDFLKDLIDYELLQLLNKTVYVPNPGNFSFINLLDCDYCSMSLFSIKDLDFTNQTLCSGYPADRLMLSLTDGDVKYDSYKQPDPYPLDILDKSRRITKLMENGVFRNGEVLPLKSHEDIIVFKEKAEKNIILLVLASKNESPYLWEYDIATLGPKQILTGDALPSRLEHCLRLLGELGHFGSIDYLKKYLDYTEYNVRWEAAKAIMLTDFESGLSALEHLKDDKHPQIQKSVSDALTQVKNLINS